VINSSSQNVTNFTVIFFLSFARGLNCDIWDSACSLLLLLPSVSYYSARFIFVSIYGENVPLLVKCATKKRCQEQCWVSTNFFFLFITHTISLSIL